VDGYRNAAPKAPMLLRMTLGTPSSHPAESAPSVRDLIARGERSISFEFFPPKDEAGERQLWTTLRELEALQPTFVSVTYGAGGSTRDRTIRVTEGIASQTTLTPMAHLTCVGHSREELRSVIGSYAAAGVRNVLALRGDPPEGPTAEFVPHPEGLHNAVELVEMCKSLGDFCVGAAAFPEVHPAAESAEADARYLVAKVRAGADFAITQLFFRPADYFALVDRVRALGADIPIIPGIMPITNLAQVTRMAELSGAALPSSIVERVSRFEGDPAAVRAEGIAIATEMCDDLLAGGAPGLHFYTLNRSKATREIYSGLRTTVGSPR
jgi:methylenetetrahydrofolate reductase (NADPH)